MLFYVSLLETETQKKNFTEIYERNRSRMYRTAYSILGQRQEAENAVHDAFVKLADKFGRYEQLSGKEMDGLCITIARNTAVNLLHRQKKVFSVEEDTLEMLYQEAHAEKIRFPEEMVIAMEEAELIRQMIKKLPAVYHDILVLRYYYGFPMKKAAKVLGISENAAQVRLHRAKGKLREAFWEREM